MENKTEQKDSKVIKRAFKVMRFWDKIFRIFCPYKLHGNVKKYKGALLVIGNHYSYMDVMFPLKITDQPVRYVAKKELWDNGGIMKKFVGWAGCLPAKRDGTDVAVVKECMRILKNGGVVNIFPEGTRNHSYAEIMPFKSGAAALSIKTRTPIVPMVKVTKIRLFKTTHVIVGDPIEFRQYYGKKVTKEQLEECDKILHDAVQNMRLSFIEEHGIIIKNDKI